MKNYWYIHGFVYWEHELHVDHKTGEIWINIGWHLPLVTNKEKIIKTIAVSAMVYAEKFN